MAAGSMEVLRHEKGCPAKRQKRSHGEGDRAIFRPGDNRWMTRLTLPDGTRKTFYGRTAAEATRKRDRARLQVSRGLPVPDESLTAGAWLTYWLEHIHRKEIKPSTYRSQHYIIRHHLVPFFDRIPLVRLTGEDVNRYLETKLDSGLTPGVLITHRGILSKAMQSAASQDRVARNVVDFTRAPKKRRNTSRVSFAPIQAIAFLRLIRGHPLEAVFLFGMTLGLRMGEATGVLWEDIDLDSRVFYLRHQVAPDVQADGGECLCGTHCGRAAVLEDLKSEASTRGLELPEILIPALRRQALRVDRARTLRLDKNKEWLDHGLVFPSASGHPMQPARVRAWLRPLSEAAGLPPCRFHDLRHAWGSLMKAAGASDEDLAQTMGHASPQVTKSIYLHALPDSARRVTALVNDLLPPDPKDGAEDQVLVSTLLSLRVRRQDYGTRAPD
jgi:integrase